MKILCLYIGTRSRKWTAKQEITSPPRTNQMGTIFSPVYEYTEQNGASDDPTIDAVMPQKLEIELSADSSESESDSNSSTSSSSKY